MNDVAGPEPAPFMRDAVKPVIGKVFRKETGDENWQRPAEIEQAILVDEKLRADRKRAEQNAEHAITETHRKRGGAIDDLVAPLLGNFGDDHFQNDQQHEGGHCERYDQADIERRVKGWIGGRSRGHAASPWASAAIQGGASPSFKCSGG